MTRNTDDSCSELTIKKITAVFEAGGYLFYYLRLLDKHSPIMATISIPSAKSSAYVTIEDN